jgi:hypothetical protein
MITCVDETLGARKKIDAEIIATKEDGKVVGRVRAIVGKERLSSQKHVHCARTHEKYPTIRRQWDHAFL